MAGFLEEQSEGEAGTSTGARCHQLDAEPITFSGQLREFQNLVGSTTPAANIPTSYSSQD